MNLYFDASDEELLFEICYCVGVIISPSIVARALATYLLDRSSTVISYLPLIQHHLSLGPIQTYQAMVDHSSFLQNRYRPAPQ